MSNEAQLQKIHAGLVSEEELILEEILEVSDVEITASSMPAMQLEYSDIQQR
ncbi:hypothetical protein [Vibrio sp. CUB2]|uniref:hypothetical protein n=1 Tax=Vibrio sp. CUB2 TaxID=2315233 RepID=UPI000A5AF5CF|nr:hypothetical protein [Vibrio sp. CUB2]